MNMRRKTYLVCSVIAFCLLLMNLFQPGILLTGHERGWITHCNVSTMRTNSVSKNGGLLDSFVAQWPAPARSFRCFMKPIGFKAVFVLTQISTCGKGEEIGNAPQVDRLHTQTYGLGPEKLDVAYIMQETIRATKCVFVLVKYSSQGRFLCKNNSVYPLPLSRPLSLFKDFS